MNDQKSQPQTEDAVELPENVIPFRRRTGRDTPPSGGSGNWLETFELGTRFLSKRKSDYGAELDEYIVATNPRQTTPVVLLGKNIQGMGVFKWFDTALFSQDQKLYLILEVIKDVDNGTVRPERMVGDAQSEVIDPIHEDE